MTEDDRTAVFRVDELGEEDVERTSDRIQREEASVFRKGEEGKCNAECKRREGGLLTKPQGQAL